MGTTPLSDLISSLELGSRLEDMWSYTLHEYREEGYIIDLFFGQVYIDSYRNDCLSRNEANNIGNEMLIRARRGLYDKLLVDMSGEW